VSSFNDCLIGDLLTTSNLNCKLVKNSDCTKGSKPEEGAEKRIVEFDEIIRWTCEKANSTLHTEFIGITKIQYTDLQQLNDWHPVDTKLPSL
jgi:hypothetical protein